jgi:hypothetical protein
LAPEGASVVRVDPVSAASGELLLAISLPPGYHYTSGAGSGFTARASSSGGGGSPSVSIRPSSGRLDGAGGSVARIAFERSGTGGGALVRVNAKVYFCRDEDVCLFEQVSFEVPFGQVDPAQTAQSVPLEYTVSPKAPVVTF